MSEPNQTGAGAGGSGDPLRQGTDWLTRTWRQWTTAEQQRMVLFGLVGAAVLGGLLWWAWRPTWKVLYSGLAPDDTRQIAALLTASNLQYDVSPDGTTLRVPAESLDKARLTTAAKASGKSGRLGFEIFDKPNWAGSDFDEKVNYQRALEGELEHTIDTLGDVASSRVHLVMPHDALFAEQQRDAKASVVLKLKARSLGDTEADAIRSLVASAVDDLKPENVVLVDADGHAPLGSRNSAADASAAYEQALADHIVQTLEPVAGEGNVRATVTADFDTSSSVETDEKYDPTAVATLSMQRAEQTSGDAAAAGGAPGTASNAPNQQPPLLPTNKAGVQSTKQEAGTYGASKKTLHVEQGPGRLRRVTAAVLVNDHSILPATKKDTLKQQPWTPDELKELTALAQAAVGYDQTRGDQVVVQNLRFIAPPAETPNAFQKILRNVAQAFPIAEPVLKYATILAVSAILFLFVLKPVLTRPLHAPDPIAMQAALPGSPARAGLPPGVAVPGEQPLFERVTEHIQRDPQQSARILQSWIKEGGGA